MKTEIMEFSKCDSFWKVWKIDVRRIDKSEKGGREIAVRNI